jgi:hypothetical protein
MSFCVKFCLCFETFQADQLLSQISKSRQSPSSSSSSSFSRTIAAQMFVLLASRRPRVLLQASARQLTVSKSTIECGACSSKTRKRRRLCARC